MKIRILFFAALKDFFQKEELSLLLPPGSTLEFLLQKIFRDEYLSRTHGCEFHPEKNNPNFAPNGASFSRDRKDMDSILKSIFLSVNYHYSPLETVLQEGDEVALLPPMAGG